MPDRAHIPTAESALRDVERHCAKIFEAARSFKTALAKNQLASVSRHRG
jgi:hypothetical protein